MNLKSWMQFFRDESLIRMDFSGQDCQGANFEKFELVGANFVDTDLRGANFAGANLRGANLERACLLEANLGGANLARADLAYAILRGANLRGADLTGTDLTRANLACADLSGATGLLDPAWYLQEHFEWDECGLIAYKTIGLYEVPPGYWKVEPGAILTEVVHPDRCNDCACGVNVATREWLDERTGKANDVWKVRIRWKDLPGVVVPYNTDGKIRAARVELIEKVKK